MKIMRFVSRMRPTVFRMNKVRTDSEKLAAQIEELRKSIDYLSKEIKRMKTGEPPKK